jgi:NAD-dependent dihydropyrimidine dehydrogenase PreA subunit
MKINQDTCIACKKCIPVCPVNAILFEKFEKMVFIDDEQCVECGVCYRIGVCPEDSFVEEELVWPRSIRAGLSNPLLVDPRTRIPGRGTEEMKTNDITGRFKPGYLGIAVEMGRPGTGASFVDIEKVAQAIAKHGVAFCPENPVTFLMTDKKTGKINPEVMNERVLSGIIEFELPVEKADAVLKEIIKVSNEIDTVFSLDVISYVGEEEALPMLEIMRQAGINPSPNGKNNMGLGRPEYAF